MSQQAGFIDTEIESKEYPIEWILARQSEALTPDGKEPRVVRVTQKTFDSLYADRGYKIVTSKK